MVSLRERGGIDAEKEERELWLSRERRKIMDSVNGMSQGWIYWGGVQLP
jgi:hypothetical protein